MDAKDRAIEVLAKRLRSVLKDRAVGPDWFADEVDADIANDPIASAALRGEPEVKIPERCSNCGCEALTWKYAESGKFDRSAVGYLDCDKCGMRLLFLPAEVAVNARIAAINAEHAKWRIRAIDAEAELAATKTVHKGTVCSLREELEAWKRRALNAEKNPC